jgi:hypothetical protein
VLRQLLSDFPQARLEPALVRNPGLRARPRHARRQLSRGPARRRVELRRAEPAISPELISPDEDARSVTRE